MVAPTLPANPDIWATRGLGRGLERAGVGHEVGLSSSAAPDCVFQVSDRVAIWEGSRDLAVDEEEQKACD